MSIKNNVLEMYNEIYTMQTTHYHCDLQGKAAAAILCVYFLRMAEVFDKKFRFGALEKQQV
jgi:hypothetical protein